MTTSPAQRPAAGIRSEWPCEALTAAAIVTPMLTPIATARGVIVSGVPAPLKALPYPHAELQQDPAREREREDQPARMGHGLSLRMDSAHTGLFDCANVGRARARAVLRPPAQARRVAHGG